MPPTSTPETPETFRLVTHRRIADIPAADWDACAGAANPFVSHAFLHALEESGSVAPDKGWIPQPMAFYGAEGRVEAAIPAYAKLHSYGEYVFDQSWAEALEGAGGRYYPKLQICAPFSPVPGPRLLRRPGCGLSLQTMGDALRRLTVEQGMSSAHITFCAESEMEGLAAAGWMPRLGLQFHWQNQGYASFDDYLAALTSSHRKSIRRERRDANAAGLTFQTLRGAEIKPSYWDAFYQFYLDTIDRKWGSAYLTRGFFELLPQRLGDKVVMMLAFDGQRPVAGALNLIGGDTLYGRNWGCIGTWPFLHFELCYYRALDFAIANGLRRVEAGAQGGHKLQRGYMPQATCSAHFIAHTGLARAVEGFLDSERQAMKGEIRELAAFSPFRATQTEG